MTGASGYIGGRLTRALLEDSLDVRIFIRDAAKIQGQPWARDVEVIEGNANVYSDLETALSDVHTAYYLLHSINLGSNFDDIEAEMARRPDLLASCDAFPRLDFSEDASQHC